MIFALDLLGLADDDWKIKPLIEIFPKGWGYGVFGPKVFGDPMKKVRQLHSSGKPSMFRLQLFYNDKHQFPSEKYLKQEIPRWDELALIYPFVKSYISPACEYQETNKSKIRDIMSLAASLAPNSAIVQSPGRVGGKVCPTFSDWYVEEHGNRARTGSDLISNDGESAYDQCDLMNEDWGIEHWIERHKNTAKYCFLWGARFNLREAHNTLPPMKRFAAPESDYTTGVCRLASEKPPVPTPIFEFSAPKKPYLLKTFAEDQQGPADKRENRPMFMVPVRKKPRQYVDIVTWDGKRVARFNLFKDGNPARKTDRYYFPKKYGWQLAEKAIKMSGSPYVGLKEGTSYKWPFHPAFRSPFFQVPKL